MVWTDFDWLGDVLRVAFKWFKVGCGLVWDKVKVSLRWVEGGLELCGRVLNRRWVDPVFGSSKLRVALGLRHAGREGVVWSSAGTTPAPFHAPRFLFLSKKGEQRKQQQVALGRLRGELDELDESQSAGNVKTAMYSC